VIIAIDGPAGSGKSTTARAVAERLGFLHLDSGAWYRALTLAALAEGIPEADWEALEEADVEALGVEGDFRDGSLAMSRQGSAIDDEELRGADVTARVSRMASVPVVRSWLLERQRELARSCDVVVDGRDIGTVVFPNAELKIYLDARPGVRARRRLAQRGEDLGTEAAVRREAARLEARDHTDAGRAIAPLRRAADAVLVDTSDLTFEEQVDAIVSLAADAAAPS
jgi:cytidylate kinase